MRRAICGADLVIAQGEHLREVICDLGVAPMRVRVVNNGVSLGEFDRPTPYAHRRPYILGLGRLMPHKGFDILLRAYALLPAEGPDLIVAGNGPESESLRTLAQSLGLGERVHFVGAVTGARKASLYASSLCFVCPSRREPFANVILEALASGVAVVATDVGGNPEMVRAGDNGLIVDRESPESLAAALRRIVGNPTLREALCAGARASAVRYSWDAIAPQYFALYREVRARHGVTSASAHVPEMCREVTQGAERSTGAVDTAGPGGLPTAAR
jgi:glycosyltransferase involved in cell wall biosynthesis